MRELNFIENNGRFGITFMSDDIAEANTVMNAIQRFISKNSKKEEEEIENKNKSFEETLKENKEIMSFGKDEEQYDYETDEDPLSADTDNINKWDFDSDGDKTDSEGNKMLFDD